MVGDIIYNHPIGSILPLIYHLLYILPIGWLLYHRSLLLREPGNHHGFLPSHFNSVAGRSLTELPEWLLPRVRPGDDPVFAASKWWLPSFLLDANDANDANALLFCWCICWKKWHLFGWFGWSTSSFLLEKMGFVDGCWYMCSGPVFTAHVLPWRKIPKLRGDSFRFSWKKLCGMFPTDVGKGG